MDILMQILNFSKFNTSAVVGEWTIYKNSSFFFFLSSWATSVFAKKNCSNKFVVWWRRETSLSVCPSFHSLVDLTLAFHLPGTHVLPLQSSQSQGFCFSKLSFSSSTHTTRLVLLFLCCWTGRNSLSRRWSLSFRCKFQQHKSALPIVFYEDLVRRLTNAGQNLQNFPEYIFVAIVQPSVHIHSAHSEDKYIRHTWQDLWSQRWSTPRQKLFRDLPQYNGINTRSTKHRSVK